LFVLRSCYNVDTIKEGRNLKTFSWHVIMNRHESDSNEKTPSLEEREGVKIEDKDETYADNGEKAAGQGSRADTDQSATESARTSSMSYEVFKGEFLAEKIQLYLPTKATTSSEQVNL